MVLMYSTMPTARWFTQQQRTLDHRVLKELFAATVQALLEEIPGLGRLSPTT